ncbi:MAG: hypothetical protein NW226_10755 [Microscillaceae bacterium]|nr:hypothetical protein [Microscillaceae bacterium]
MKKWLKRIGIGVLVLFGLGALGFLIVHESIPTGEAGEKADALARKMMTAINDEAWKNTEAIRWDFGGRHKLLWDRKRHFAQVSWDENVVLINNHNMTGIVKQKKFDNKESDEELIREAWEIWVNDSFWLNPVSKVFDPGTIRKLVKMPDGKEALLITYQSGGVTPGDSYLWIVDEKGLPTAWKLWVDIVPFGGFRFSWEEWVTLATGVKVSTFHHSTLFDLRLSDIQAATTLAGLVGAQDPFAELESIQKQKP